MACCYKSSLGHVSLKVNTLPEGAKLSPCPPIGDVDQDGYVTNSDTRAVLNIVAKLDPYKNPTADQLTRANVDTRNNNVTSVDSLMIKYIWAGLKLPSGLASNPLLLHVLRLLQHLRLHPLKPKESL